MPPAVHKNEDKESTDTRAETSVTVRDSTMSDVLTWVGFLKSEQKILKGQLGDSPKNFLTITSRELEQVAKELASTSSGTAKMTIGLTRMKLLKGLIHWANDKERIGLEVTMQIPSNDEVGAKFEFLEELRVSIERQGIRMKTTESQSEARSKTASPGKLKDERQWDKWEKGLVLMLSILRGVNGVPLSYVIREKEHQRGVQYNSFIDESVAKVSLKGPPFEADTRTVHETIEMLTGGENATHWLKELENKADGRKDMTALRSHFRGAGNQSRRISSAQGLHATLHYKNEQAMKFTDFITKVKAMFDIYQDCGEPQTESAKLRFLWDKVDSAYLQIPMEVSKAALSHASTSWTFVTACDHLASQIAVDGKPKVKFAASAIDSGKAANKSNIMKDGKLFTGSYPGNEWFKVLTKDEHDKVTAERRKGGKPHFAKKGKQDNNREVQALEKKLKKSKKTISSLKRATNDDEDEASSDTGSSADGDNAGNAFGGRAEKQRKKKKKN
jgi:hypothetical protein